MKSTFPWILALAAGVPVAAVRAQATWRPLPELSRRTGHAMAYDPIRDRVVLFGGAYVWDAMGDTWEWAGKGWELRRPPVSPSPRLAPGMAFDPVRKTVLLFGGSGEDKSTGKQVWHSDTWEWDGQSWSKLNPATSPVRRHMAAMTTDWGRSRIVLFGGFTDVGAGFFGRPLNDTWEWDGKNWIQRSPRTLPRARGVASFAFHVKTRRIAMFGGHNNGSNWFTDTWEWDGKDWISFSPRTSPPVAFSGMVPDPFTGAVLLYSGGDLSRTKMSTWRWDGQNWSDLGQTLNPAYRGGFELAPDPLRRQVILFGGVGPKPGPWHDTHAWDGKAWRKLYDSPFPEDPVSVVVHDGARDEFLVLEPANGLGPAKTWVMFDGVFRRLKPAIAPLVFSNTKALLYHPGLRKVFYLFGDGQANYIWLWDGKQWTKTRYQKGPDGRSAHLAWDGHRQKMVDYDPRTGELWEWDPSGWTRLAATSRPPRRCCTAFGYDPLRRRLVLYGGSPPSGWPYLDDTWEWDGTRWLRMSPKTRPLARISAGMAYVPALGGMVLFAGQGLVPPGIHQPLPDTWLWDGKDWTKLAVPPLPSIGLWKVPFVPLVSSAYDAGRQRLVAFYRVAGSGKPVKSMWEFLFESLKTTQPYPRPGERFQVRVHLPGQAGQVFLLVLSGAARPGIPLRRVAGLGVELLPLSPDPLFWASLGSWMLTRLDGKGNAAIPLAIPGDNALLWLRFHAAGLTLDPRVGVAAITNDVALQIVK